MDTNTILGLLDNLLIHTFILIDSTECRLSLMYSLSLWSLPLVMIINQLLTRSGVSESNSNIFDLWCFETHTQNWSLAMLHGQFMSSLWFTIHPFFSELLLLQVLLMVLKSSIFTSFHETCLSSVSNMKLPFYVQKRLYSPIEKFQGVRKFRVINFSESMINISFVQNTVLGVMTRQGWVWHSCYLQGTCSLQQPWVQVKTL